MRALLASLTLLAAIAPAASAQTTARPPTPEPNFAVDVAPRPCALEGRDKYEQEFYAREGWGAPDYERYPGNCQRLRFSYGPIAVKPGQNDVLIEPVKIEKPLRDGYITRFKPDLVRADGAVPPIEQVHLHHGTWLSVPDYGSGPFFAAGEEKTIAPFPKGYGMPIKASDQWLLLYMVHSAVQQPMEVYITYDIDFIPKAKGEALGLKSAYPLWFDVRPSSYPVFNVQRDFGGDDGTCTWPAEKCAAHDPFGKELVGQGQPGNGKGTDWKFPKPGEDIGLMEKFNGGTIIGIGGHLHPGGLQNTIDLVRPGNEVMVKKKVKVKSKKRGKNGKRKVKTKTIRVKEKRETARIYTGDAVYWDRQDRLKGGGPPTSWDFSMTVTGLPTWGVHVKPERHHPQQRDLRHHDPVHLREHGHRRIAVRAERRERQPAGAGRRPVRHSARLVRRVPVRRSRGQEEAALRQGASSRTATSPRTTTSAARAVSGRPRAASRRARSGSPTSSTPPATCR